MERIPLLIGIPVGFVFFTGPYVGGISAYWLIAGLFASTAILWIARRLAFRSNKLKRADKLAEYVSLATKGTSTVSERLLLALAAGATTLLMLVLGASVGYAFKVWLVLGAGHGA